LFETDGWAGNGWDAKAPQQPQPDPEPDEADPELDDDDDLDPDEELDEDPPEDPVLPPLYAHGDPDPRPIKAWLIKHLIPAVGHGLLSGQ
jgi:hypothetical protein